MDTNLLISESALQTIEIEGNAIFNLKNFINADFIASVNAIFNSKGRTVITGIGKSAIIAQKIVATLNSTGTPSIFMHAADAIHGDLGIIQPDDVVICISKSGNTPEITALVPFLKARKNILIGMVGNTNSTLAKQSHFVLDTTVDIEACPNNLAPTSSSTAQLVMGDALAVALLKLNGFSSNDFAQYHPGGALGKQLYLKVADLFIHNAQPKVKPEDSIDAVILEISSKRLGATAVIAADNSLAGVITDGDLRRTLHENKSLANLKASDIMNSNPKTIVTSDLAVNALQLMKEKSITQLIVVDESAKYLGIIHLHDILKEGIS